MDLDAEMGHSFARQISPNCRLVDCKALREASHCKACLVYFALMSLPGYPGDLDHVGLHPQSNLQLSQTLRPEVPSPTCADPPDDTRPCGSMEVPCRKESWQVKSSLHHELAHVALLICKEH